MPPDAPTAPTTATPATAAPATPGPGIASPAAPAVAAPAAPAARRRIDGVQKKAYGTRPAQHSPPPKVAASAATSASNEGPSAVGPAAASGADAAAGSPAPDKPGGVPSAAPAAEGAAADPPAEAAKLTEAEESKRLARINRADQKVAAERQQLAHDRQTFAAERQHHAAALAELDQVRQLVPTVRQNPLAFLQKFGVGPQQILDAIVADGAKPAATKVQEQLTSDAAEWRAKVAELEKSVQTAAETQRQQALAREVEAYKTSAILPVLADTAKYELTHRVLGSKAADEVHALQQQRYLVTQSEVQQGRRQQPEVLSPAQAADLIEQHLRSQRDLLSGTTVEPAKAPQTTARTEPAPVKTSGSQTTKPATAGSWRHPPKPYQVKSVR